ncbi:MAG TPA: HD domain-containing phosphohydrolase [Catenuloplanes sp.]|jgi:diguanylate cyclase (GGDEF)-like protein
MTVSGDNSAAPRLLTRVTVIGMSLAVLALGGLAVWSAYVAQGEARGLARAGVQITGQLGTVQALYVIRMESDALEDEFTDAGVARLRTAVREMPANLARMESGDSAEATRVARTATPLAIRLAPAVERFLADPKGDIRYRGDDGDDTAEDAMEEIIAELELLLNDSGSDPAQLLNGKLARVTAAGQTVGRAAAVLVPVGLGGVLVCGWLMRVYRRRSEATMRAALEATAREARTDQLTGLPNRRALIEELHRRVAAGRPFTFAMADLNGFKHYNDTFGHPAGDALLRRLGDKLGTAWRDHGYAARLGGDEFCVVTDRLTAGQVREVLHEALRDEGEGFSVSAVCGLADVPMEAPDASAALSLADTRLYAAKAVFHAANRHLPGRTAAVPAAPGADQPTVALLQASYPGVGTELDRTARWAVACAVTLGLPADQIASIERAAQLHDIGKAALPAAILAKRGSLTDEEQRFVRKHTAIGERLLSNVDDLEPVAAIVRASQERWNGDGYPDQLVGEQIPLSSRIIAVATAFCAMTSDRPHAAARSVDEALAELSRCSGTQFDPAVVAAFTDAVTLGVALDPVPAAATPGVRLPDAAPAG